MNQETASKENPYNNEVAYKDLIKMMRRKDLITVAFIVDRFGYWIFSTN